MPPWGYPSRAKNNGKGTNRNNIKDCSDEAIGYAQPHDTDAMQTGPENHNCAANHRPFARRTVQQQTNPITNHNPKSYKTFQANKRAKKLQTQHNKSFFSTRLCLRNREPPCRALAWDRRRSQIIQWVRSMVAPLGGKFPRHHLFSKAF